MIVFVLCERCGTLLDRPGQAHPCRTAFPASVSLPVGWQALSAVTGGAVQLVLVTFLVVAVLAGWLRLRHLAADSAAQTYAATTAPPSASRSPLTWPAEDPEPAVDEPAPQPQMTTEQPRGLAPHGAPLTAHATDADWNPHHWDPEDQPPRSR